MSLSCPFDPSSFLQLGRSLEDLRIMEFHLRRHLHMNDFEEQELKKLEFMYGKLLEVKSQEAKAMSPESGDSKWRKSYRR